MSDSEDSYKWWRSRLREFNTNLIACIFLAGFVYVAAISIFPAVFPDAEITVFTILTQSIGILVFIFTSNIIFLNIYKLDRVFSRIGLSRQHLYLIYRMICVLPFLFLVFTLLVSVSVSVLSK